MFKSHFEHLRIFFAFSLLLWAIGCQSGGDGKLDGSGIQIGLTPFPLTERAGEQSRLRVLTYNIERGLQEGSGQKIANLLLERRPDIVCLQEIAWPKGKYIDIVDHQAESLADLIGYEWVCAEGGRLRNENYGMAVLVRGHIISARPLKLEGERNHALIAEVEIDGRHLWVVSVHAKSLGSGPHIAGFLRTEGVRVEQARQLLEALQDVHEPIVVAGDFNTLPMSPSYWVMTDRLRDAAADQPGGADYTRLTEGLPARIDYVFLSRQAVVHRYEVIGVDYSDHRPVMVTYSIR